jgi:Raf kinase inhibitor-like YbhB/YbcL family protein
MAIRLTSSAFSEGGPLPRRYTADGSDVSPPLAWDDPPPGTRSLALICDDPDAPRAQPWVHWVLYRIPPQVRSLAEGDSGGGVAGRNDFGRLGYGGPAPPRGHGRHRYFFKLYALDTDIDLPPGASKEQLLRAMQGHVLDSGQLMGTYER